MFYTVFIHDGNVYCFPHQMRMPEINEWLRVLHTAAAKALKDTGSDHCIYATKTYEGGELDEVNLYESLVLLDDDEFDKRTGEFLKEHPDSVVYAVHALK